MNSMPKNKYNRMLRSILKRIKLRTWISLGILFILLPLALFTVFYWDSLLAALGGSNATPIAVWHFDEGVDNTCANGTDDVCDSSGNTANGTRDSSVWQTEDKCVSGKCLNYDGTDDTVTISDNAALD